MHQYVHYVLPGPADSVYEGDEQRESGLGRRKAQISVSSSRSVRPLVLHHEHLLATVGECKVSERESNVTR